MQNIRHRLIKFFRAWRAARRERQLLLDILNKPGDRLLLDAGITREKAVHIVGRYWSVRLWHIPAESPGSRNHFEWSNPRIRTTRCTGLSFERTVASERCCHSTFGSHLIID
jgi:uncharacterized protein YjiS (DUF1127 family)